MTLKVRPIRFAFSSTTYRSEDVRGTPHEKTLEQFQVRSDRVSLSSIVWLFFDVWVFLPTRFLNRGSLHWKFKYRIITLSWLQVQFPGLFVSAIAGKAWKNQGAHGGDSSGNGIYEMTDFHYDFPMYECRELRDLSCTLDTFRGNERSRSQRRENGSSGSSRCKSWSVMHRS